MISLVLFLSELDVPDVGVEDSPCPVVLLLSYLIFGELLELLYLAVLVLRVNMEDLKFKLKVVGDKIVEDKLDGLVDDLLAPLVPNVVFSSQISHASFAICCPDSLYL